MTEQQITIKNIFTNYKILGKGKPILILHGWRSNSSRWQKTAEILAKKNFMAIIPDLPGFGKSQEPKNVWNIDGYVEWLKEFSQRVPELKNDFYLAGHSFGGSVAAKFSLKYNQKVKKLFLISASAVRVTNFSKKLSYNISRIFKIFYFFPFYESFRKNIYRIFFRKSDYPYVSGIMKEIYLRVVSDDLSHKLPFLKVPTVIIWGQKDDLTPLENAYIIKEKIAESKLIIIPEQGHNMHIICPEILAKEIASNI